MPSPKVTVEDVDAFSDISNGSTISVGSAASSSGHATRPPHNGPRRSKSGQGGRTKTASKSPYASKQKTPDKPQPMKATSRNLWINAMRNGSGSLSTENSGMNTWAGSKPSHAKQAKPGTRGRHFSDIVQVSDFKGKGHTRSASMSASEPHMSTGAPAYKPPEDYYDEIIDLKKMINALTAENSVLCTKLHRVEQDNVLKERKIEDLLNPRKQPEDVRRTLTDRKGDTSAIVNSLKQKLHSMERTVKDKETELRELKRDLKMSNIEELEIQSEAYYQEIQRLQLILLEMQQTQVHEPVRLTGSPRSIGSSGRVRGGGSVQRIQEENRQLIAENQSLKKDLLTAIESMSTDEKRTPLSVDYADMNRSQLLQRIHDLEQRQESRETKKERRVVVGDESDIEQEQTPRKSSVKEVKGRAELHGTPSQKLSQLREVEGDMLEEREKTRSTIVQLKQDRAHYRSVADDLRLQLKSLQEQTEIKMEDHPTAQSERKRSFNSSSSVKKSSLRRPSLEARINEPDNALLQEFQRDRAAKTLQREWRKHKGNKQYRNIEDKNVEDKAASTLQKNWRKYRHGQNQRAKGEEDEAVTEIQAALRAHTIRRQQLQKFDDAPEMTTSDDAIVELQSAFRGHLARRRNREEPEDEWTDDAERRLRRDRGASWDRKEESSDDDLELGASASWSDGQGFPYPGNSSRRHSSYRDVPQTPEIPLTVEQSKEKNGVIGVMSQKAANQSAVSRKQEESLRGVQKFDTLSEDSEEDVHVSSAHARLKSSSSQFRTESRQSISKINTTKESKSAREIIDSDEDDDDDIIVTSSSKAKRALDTGMVQRPKLSRAGATVTSPSSGASETRKPSLTERLGLTKKKSSVNSERASVNSRKSSQGKFSRQGSAVAKAPNSTRGNTDDDDDEDSDDDIVMPAFRNKRASVEAKDGRSGLKTKETTGSKRGSIVDSLFSSPTSSSDKKSSFRRKSLLEQSDDDDDDDDGVVVSSSKIKSKSLGRASVARQDSQSTVANLWGAPVKSSDSVKKKTSSSSLGFGSEEKPFISRWSREMELEDTGGASHKSRLDSQLDELF